MPVTRAAVERSITKLQKEISDIPDYPAGYDEWRGACGGVYTIPVAEAVAIGEATFRKGEGCESNSVAPTVPTFLSLQMALSVPLPFSAWS
jgi:hypothetical protein